MQERTDSSLCASSQDLLNDKKPMLSSMKGSLRMLSDHEFGSIPKLSSPQESQKNLEFKHLLSVNSIRNQQSRSQQYQIIAMKSIEKNIQIARMQREKYADQQRKIFKNHLNYISKSQNTIQTLQKSIDQESSEEIKQLFDLSPSSSQKKTTFEQNYKMTKDLEKYNNKNGLNISNTEQQQIGKLPEIKIKNRNIMNSTQKYQNNSFTISSSGQSKPKHQQQLSTCNLLGKEEIHKEDNIKDLDQNEQQQQNQSELGHQTQVNILENSNQPSVSLLKEKINYSKKNVIFDILSSKVNSNCSSTSVIRTNDDADDEKKKINNYYLNHNIVLDKLNKSALSNFKFTNKMKNIFPKTSQNTQIILDSQNVAKAQNSPSSSPAHNSKTYENYQTNDSSSNLMNLDSNVFLKSDTKFVSKNIPNNNTISQQDINHNEVAHYLLPIRTQTPKILGQTDEKTQHDKSLISRNANKKHAQSSSVFEDTYVGASISSNIEEKFKFLRAQPTGGFLVFAKKHIGTNSKDKLTNSPKAAEGQYQLSNYAVPASPMRLIKKQKQIKQPLHLQKVETENNQLEQKSLSQLSQSPQPNGQISKYFESSKQQLDKITKSNQVSSQRLVGKTSMFLQSQEIVQSELVLLHPNAPSRFAPNFESKVGTKNFLNNSVISKDQNNYGQKELNTKFNTSQSLPKNSSLKQVLSSVDLSTTSISLIPSTTPKLNSTSKTLSEFRKTNNAYLNPSQTTKQQQQQLQQGNLWSQRSVVQISKRVNTFFSDEANFSLFEKFLTQCREFSKFVELLFKLEKNLNKNLTFINKLVQTKNYLNNEIIDMQFRLVHFSMIESLENALIAESLLKAYFKQELELKQIITDFYLKDLLYINGQFETYLNAQQIAQASKISEIITAEFQMVKEKEKQVILDKLDTTGFQNLQHKRTYAFFNSYLYNIQPRRNAYNEIKEFEKNFGIFENLGQIERDMFENLEKSYNTIRTSNKL